MEPTSSRRSAQAGHGVPADEHCLAPPEGAATGPAHAEPSQHEPELLDAEQLESMREDSAPPIESRYLRGRPSPRPRPRFTPDPEPAPPPQSRAAGVARVTGLITASVALCAAITTSALTSNHRESQSISDISQHAELTGIRALDPQAAAGYAPAPSSGGQTITGTTTPSVAPPGRPSSPPASSSTLPSSSSSSSSSPRVDVRSAASPEEVLSFVHTFYQLLDRNPRDALRLVDPALVEDQGDDLARAWENVDDVRVGNIDPREGNTVLAAVSMRERDGARLRLRQLLRLTGPRDPLITEAQVLSVHRD